MSTLEIIFLAIIQGLTEFLPISSSAHLILPSQVLGWKDQGQALDVALHVGTLLAVVIYYRKEVGSMAVAWFGTVGIGPEKNNKTSFDGKLAWWIIFASIPLGVFGLLGKDFIEENLRKKVQLDIQDYIDNGSIRGFRHRHGLPVRGQRTHTNARTQKKRKFKIISSYKDDFN